jgi:predicted amino acid racemase
VRQEPEFFGEEELDLLYIAKKLDRALKLEEALTAAGVDYAVEVDEYLGGFIFRRARAGAFFYVRPSDLDRAREVAVQHGYRLD